MLPVLYARRVIGLLSPDRRQNRQQDVPSLKTEKQAQGHHSLRLFFCRIFHQAITVPLRQQQKLT
tara:strand:- start:734 stop:928 length:195 start_codon:yes stop_codon:yes gene_type:complete